MTRTRTIDACNQSAARSLLEQARQGHRLHKMARPSQDDAEPPFDEADAYGHLARKLDTPANRAEASRQWSAIPTDPDELRKWMRGEPINRGDVQ